MNKLNILIIDRSETVCAFLKDKLENNSLANRVYTSTQLSEGLRYLEGSKVHVVLLDVMIQEYNGQSSLKSILSTKVLPIVMLSDPNVEQMAKTVTAMSNGALDFIKKVDFSDKEKFDKFESELMLKLLNVNQANRLRSIARKVKDNPLKEQPVINDTPVQVVEPVSVSKSIKKKGNIIAIGTSTGGPRALHQVIQQIPKSFNESILIVQHMPAGFTKSLAERLNNIGNIRVKEAEHAEKIEKATAYLAPGNYHMQVKERHGNLYIELSQDHDHLPHRPSVDLLFQSIAKLEDWHKIAAVLTGMGRDGANGVVEIKMREEEAVILSESKETAVIDGMPRAAFETNLVTQVFRIDQIGTAIAEYTNKRGN